MVPVGTAAKASWCPAISRCWRCRRTARSSIRSSGFGTICAVTGSPTRCFPAWRTSSRPARWPGTGLPTTTAWSARSARSPGLRLHPLCRAACYRTVVCDRKHTQVRKYPEIRIILSDDRLQFPLAQHTAAVYRFRVRSSSGSEAVYFGETDDLERRLTHYRNPGSSQITNIRLNNLFREALSTGAEIAVAIVAPGAWIDFGGTRSAADFSSKPVRLSFENAAIVESHGTLIETESLN